MSAGDGEQEVDVIAGLVERLGVLLAAGVSPASAWRHLAAQTSARSSPSPASRRAARVVRETARATAAGSSVDAALMLAIRDERNATEAGRGSGSAASRAWRAVAAAWTVSARSGAPLAPALAQLALGLRDLGETEREVALALAGPRTSGIVVAMLPLVGLGFGGLLGFDVARTLTATPPGLVCLVLGLGIAIVGVLWSRTLLKKAAPASGAPGLRCDLVAVALAGGDSASAAAELVDEALVAVGFDPDDGPAGDRAHGERRSIENILGLAVSAGVPAAVLLRSEAMTARRVERARGRTAAARLGVLLLLPVGICILPAFLLLGVAPVIIAIVSSTVTGF